MKTKRDHVRHQPKHRTPAELTEEQISYIWKGVPRLNLSKIKKSQFLIKLFLAEASIQLVYGSFGTRKTTLMLLAGWAVARGKRFMGRTTHQRWVLYLDYENPAGALKSYCEDLGIDPSNPAFTIWDQAEEDAPVPGNDTDAKLKDFIRRCRKITGRYPWIILDSWTSLLKSGESGNALGEAAPIFQAIRKYRNQGATVTIIDHTGHRGTHPIGSSAKMTQMDTSHLFTAEKETNNLDGSSSHAVIRVESFLKRFAPKGIGTFSVEVRGAVDKDGIWHTLSAEPTKDKDVLKSEQRIGLLRKVIEKHREAGEVDVAKKAAKAKDEKDKQIIGINSAMALLKQGDGKYWQSSTDAKGKKTYQIIGKTAE